MKSNNKILRGFSIFLTAVIVFLSLHITASAEMTVHIKSYNPLDVTEYTFDEGTDEQTVIDSLPKTITAQVEITTYVEGASTASSSISTDDNYQISVGWISHDYRITPGEYTFMGSWAGKGYTYSSNLAYPTVTVKVVAKTTTEPEDKPEDKPEEEPPVKPDTKPDSTPTPNPNPAPTTGETTTPTVEDNKTRTPSQLPINPDTTTDNKKSEETTAPVDNKDKEVKDNKEDNTKKPSSDSSSSNTESNKSNSNNKSSNNSSSSAASASQVAKVSTVNIEAHADAPAESSNNSSNTRHTASNGVSKAVASSNQTALASDEDETTEVSEEVFEETEIPVSLTSKTDTKAELSVGKGKAVINVEKGNSSDICARTTDDETLLKNILTEEQLKRVAEGATVNLKITANVVSEDELSADDSKNINDGVEKYKKDVPGLSVAGYVDLSIYLQLDDEDWSYVSNTNKPVELVINVPKSMQGLSKNYYILRLHDGETTMFSDNDDDPETITISTGKFSIYVIMYDSEAAAEIEKTEKNEMSILIIFLLVLLVVLIVQIIYIFIIRKKLHKAEQV